MTIDWYVWLAPVILVPIVALFVFVGCQWLLPFKSSSTGGANCYRCTVPVYKCVPDFTIPYLPNFRLPPFYTLQPPATSSDKTAGLQVGKAAYMDKIWTIQRIGAAQLIGAAWIQAPYDDTVSGGQPLQFDLDASQAIRVYVAYDHAATTNPDWLQPGQGYKPMLDANGNPISIQIAGPGDGNLTPGGGHKIQLDLYRSLWDGSSTHTFLFPPNRSGGATWPAAVAPCNYLVIVEPARSWDCSAGVQTPDNWLFDQVVMVLDASAHDNVKLEDDAKQKAKQEAGKEIDRLYQADGLKRTTGAATADAVGTYDPDPSQVMPAYKTYSYRRNSQIRADPAMFPAAATVTTPDQKLHPFTITGQLDFEYTLDDLGRIPQMRVQGMALMAVPASPSDSDFKNVSLILLAPAVAIGQGPPPAFGHTPFDYYLINTGTFIVSLSTVRGGDTYVGVGSNCRPVTIKIDQTTRSFHLVGGPIAVKPSSGQGDQLDVYVDVTAYFEHFAIVARGSESQHYVECSEERNCCNLGLDAGASFQIYGLSLPANNQNYRWYKDYCLVTEKLLGNDRHHVIPPHTLSFGFHNISLVLKDDHDVLSTDTFEVEVGDTKPPDLHIPKNIVRHVKGKAGDLVHVDIGKASATDVCSKNVAITNDAPAGYEFPAGNVSKVTWTADDGHGNLSQAQQQITLMASKNKHGKELHSALAQLHGVLEDARAQVEGKPAQELFPLDFAALIQISETLAGQAAQMQAHADAEAGHRQLVRHLENVVAALRTVRETFSSALRQEEDGRRLLETAPRELAAAADVLKHLKGLGEPG